MPVKLFLYIFIIGLLSGFVFISLLKNVSLKYKILFSKGMPLVGGLGLVLSFIFSILIAFFIHEGMNIQIKGIILASLLMLVFGFIDDWREFSIIAKFIVQIIATTLLIIFGIKTQIMHIGNFLNILITYIWVLGVTNAFNHLDIIDGLCAGIGLSVSLSFFVISLLGADLSVAKLSLVLAAVILSFLFYNFPPAKVYLGNAGSHFLGFSLAAIAIVISYAPLERKVALLSPILILGLPIFDTAFLIFMRLKNKKAILKKSRDHLALRFLNLGYRAKKVLLFMYVLGAIFSISGILVSQLSNQWGVSIIALVLIVVLTVARKMGKVAGV